ncbi:acyl carrier protein [Rhodobacter sphaeroides]|jgi:Acyl carrier protein|uniref:Acyl carrier protein n=1 Tax=Cereibacter sphaeroides (strain ATCC 17023 / DSM 158 / JCM 6121 / CCUG 31486 / LMG 2827 / NBRC 12203 / NCIMB 8253 / ATH 2.4.1.) TaxID=272943 RepID=Q3J6A9_CERS4|nr:acyl carrier protein [Cereibacter sphaeroides]ABA77675.1 putative acyl carrier protein [Cereibacter sphaeroides 2.4.1]AMJ46077.1 acyl carrier protein [Cereibacter sphaeroides]ANS32789.1 acyl carrier protein [Cereibacter sphaeroides]ATN61841.1 acyl carrier protein [Cereibacter sphaeroides]AXC59924.1 acyl carrier protein [Cereibacter sphaeroides 2.4.1]
MTDPEIYDGLTSILRQVFDDPELVATPDLSAHDVAEWDSFNHINIVVASEMRFGVSFRSSELEDLKNVGDFVALIRDKKAA